MSSQKPFSPASPKQRRISGWLASATCPFVVKSFLIAGHANAPAGRGGALPLAGPARTPASPLRASSPPHLWGGTWGRHTTNDLPGSDLPTPRCCAAPTSPRAGRYLPTHLPTCGDDRHGTSPLVGRQV